MKKHLINQGGTITRRETLSMLLSAGFTSLLGLNSFAKETINFSNIKSNDKMNRTSKQNEQIMKTIGILGGMSAQATMDLEMRIHKVSQKLIPQAENSGYPPMIVEYYRHPPVLLTQDRQPVTPFQIDPRLLESARILGSVTDFLLIASNGVHLFQNEIEQASGRKVMSMIDATLTEVEAKGWERIGVLGLMNPKIYATRLDPSGFDCVTIDSALQGKLNQAIFKVMEGNDGEKERAVAMEAIEQLRSKNVNGIIPGCTEIPLLLGELMDAADLVNPVQLLAEKAVRFAMNNS